MQKRASQVEYLTDDCSSDQPQVQYTSLYMLEAQIRTHIKIVL